MGGKSRLARRIEEYCETARFASMTGLAEYLGMSREELDHKQSSGSRDAQALRRARDRMRSAVLEKAASKAMDRGVAQLLLDDIGQGDPPAASLTITWEGIDPQDIETYRD